MFSSPRSRPLQRFILAYISICLLVTASWPCVSEELPTRTLPSFDLLDCIEVGLQNRPSIDAAVQDAAIASHEVQVAASNKLPQIDYSIQYFGLDEPRSVDIDNPIEGQAKDVFTDAATFFGIARQSNTTIANGALDNPDTPLFPGGPTFNSIKQDVDALIPGSISVPLLGENVLQSRLRFAQPLWTGGKITSRHSQARLGADVARLEVSKTRQTVRFEVSQAYNSILLAAEMTAAFQEAEERTTYLDNLASRLVQRGSLFVDKIDQQRVATFRHLFGERRASLMVQQRRAYSALKLAMGLNQTAEFMLADSRLPDRSEYPDLSSLINAALSNRPEVSQARLGVRVANYERDAARANFHPNVVAFAEMITIDDDRGFANPNDSSEWSAGIQAGIPIYTGGRNKARLAQSGHQRAGAIAREQQVVQWVQQQTKDAYLELQENEARLAEAKRAVDSANQAADLHAEQMRVGNIDEVDMPKFFEDSVTMLFALIVAQGQETQARYGYQMALAKLRLATGQNEI